jgi:hypothetical protein
MLDTRGTEIQHQSHWAACWLHLVSREGHKHEATFQTMGYYFSYHSGLGMCVWKDTIHCHFE